MIAWGRDYLNSQDSQNSSADSYTMLTDMRKYIMDDLFDRVTGEQFADNLSDCTVDIIMNWYWASKK